MQDEALAKYWHAPHFGFFAETIYRSFSSYDLYRQRFDGYELRANLESFVTPHVWQRAMFTYESGTFKRHFYLAHEISVFTGHRLTIINKHLLGGSWDLPRVNKAYGSRLFQYRLENGIAFNVRADYPICPDLDASLQLGYMATENTNSLGAVLKLFMLYRGLLMEAGSGYQAGSPLIFTRLTFAMF